MVEIERLNVYFVTKIVLLITSGALEPLLICFSFCTFISNHKLNVNFFKLNLKRSLRNRIVKILIVNHRQTF